MMQQVAPEAGLGHQASRIDFTQVDGDVTTVTDELW